MALASPAVLGIDLGTSSVKVVLLPAGYSEVRNTQAEVPSAAGDQGREQDARKIIRALNECLAALPRQHLQKVTCIGVSGQMHGVMFWQTSQACQWIQSGMGQMFEPKEVSHLVTWEDARCSREFLASLPQPWSHQCLATGFGCATIYWYLKNSPDFLKQYSAAGTIQDYVVAMLCGLKQPRMSVQNAASWGYFNCRSKCWNADILKESGFPISLLPEIAKPGSTAGSTSCEWFSIPSGADVGVALGDFQCSVYSCMNDTTDAVLNISTSAQLTFSMPSEFEPPETPDCHSALAYFPYFDGKYLAVAASLNGGNVLATFVKMLSGWIAELGLDVPDSTIYTQMIRAALIQSSPILTVYPTIFGERHAPDHLASVSNITTTQLSLGHVTRALCRGIVQNLHSMMSAQLLRESGVKRIVGSGSALSRNEVLRQEVEMAFPFPLVYRKDVSSAMGAAMVMLYQR
ncbi:sedoheptulokinase [Microcaecilia unicolor]|uniref:Sedoheptulokinase n=1 Tax=Microcaecilia unicolor TaxID=1415580 RepID=A0A6P7XY56_9AMPH|nr:sedoheptulokinase [Microcaecilia unicolor]